MPCLGSHGTKLEINKLKDLIRKDNFKIVSSNTKVKY